MIDGMVRKEKKSRKKSKDKDWLLYILGCADGTFYTGVTKDLENRLKMHQKGKASKYTRARLPVELLYQEACGTRTQALVRECEVKGYDRKRKEKLIESE